MDFFFDTSLIFLALVVVLVVAFIAVVLLIRDLIRLVIRKKRRPSDPELPEKTMDQEAEPVGEESKVSEI